MKTQLLSISKIFTERILRIPDYQRGYAWTEKELRDFWNDLIQLENEKNHYTGVLTLEDVSDNRASQWHDDLWIIQSKNYAPYYVVDGQQRLTTTIILIQAIIECVPENTRLNFTTAQEIRKKFIFDTKDEGISRSYLFGYEKDNPSYEFLKTKIFLEKTDSSLPIQETIYTYNLEFAKKYFLTNLKELTLDQIEILYRKLTQNFLFNIYAISDDIDVFVAFETMNNRGKPLSHLELLKNRLIYISTKFKADDFEKQKLRTAINEVWKSIYHYLGRNKEKILDDDIFLSNHFSLYFSHEIQSKEISLRDFRYRRHLINRHSGYGEYLLEQVFTPKNIVVINPNVAPKDELTIEKIYNYVQSLKDSVQLWYYILNPQHSDFSTDEKIWLEKLNRQPIPIFISVAPLIMIFYQKETNEQFKVRFLKALERYLFTSTLTRYAYLPEFEQYKLRDFAVQFRKGEISSEKIIKDIDDFVDSFINKKENLEQVISDMKSSGFYRWFGLKYFLYEYELSLKKRTKTYREKLNWEKFTENGFFEGEDQRDYYTIEHIYPQKPKKSCWTEKFKHYTERERRLLRNSLGNLVPLSERKNQAFENECFEYKKGDAKSMVGYKYGSYSENQIANYDVWTAKEILEQGLKMLEFLEKRWNFNLGSKKDKAKFLHIEFVAEKENLPLE